MGSALAKISRSTLDSATDPKRTMLRLIKYFSVVAIAILISGCATQGDGTADNETAPPDDSESVVVESGARLEQLACWFPIPEGVPETTCFRMFVPEVYGDQESSIINFPVVKIASSGDSNKSPVLHLGGGGPGNPIGLGPNTAANWLWSWYQEVSTRNGRDLYIMDPRGVGMAQPVLVCKEYIPAFLASLSKNLTVDDELKWNIEVNKQCVSRLEEQGINLGGYNSLSVARDVESLRRALNIDYWSLYGVSYGSRYALTIAREYGETVESMVLDAAVFPNVRYMDNYSKNLEKAFERLIGYCNGDQTCKQSLVDPGGRFWQLVRKLKQTPVRSTIKHPVLDIQMNIVINGERFLSIFFNSLYDAQKFRELPGIIQSLENNQLGSFEANIHEWLAFQTDDDYGDASAAAHFCYEESPFIDYNAALLHANSMRHELSESSVAQLRFNQEQCSRWPATPGNPIEGEPVQTAIPTLMLHGALDPVLPVEDLQNQLSHFDNVDYEIFSEMSHSIVGMHPCGEAIASAFFDHKLAFRSHLNCQPLN